jgi:hypothetical protein
MFYKQFIPIIDILNPEFVEKFDYWLATLPISDQRHITASIVSSRLAVSYSQADAILKYSEKQGILQKQFLIKCPDCNSTLEVITKDEIPDILMEPQYCYDCEDEKCITVDDIYTAYEVILQPDATEEEIAKAIEDRLLQSGDKVINFSQADSLANDRESLYECFYNPDESAYEALKKMWNELDNDYGKNTTAKGSKLEKLVLKLFSNIRYVKVSNDIRTLTNQFDCTVLCGLGTRYLSVFSYMTPYFIVECKNEPDKKPNNTYCNKLLSIMETNESQLGIIFGRRDATKTCYSIAREHYLLNLKSRKQQIIITFSNNDLKYLVDKRVNLLEYLEFKIFQVTNDSPNAVYEMFEKNDFSNKIK